MGEQKQSAFPKEFPKCQHCSGTETLTRMGLREAGMDVFGSMEKLMVPLSDPRTSPLMVTVLLVHYDICANCGIRRCTKAEIMKIPASNFQMQSQAGPQHIRPSHRPS